MKKKNIIHSLTEISQIELKSNNTHQKYLGIPNSEEDSVINIKDI